ncbi:MAG: SDR family oxidoreductase [Opitutales bacterium]|nr:SDR family oxidoreductase [Opitutales bacterium]NRA27389.1 SDR family oxidoreductase [Opitutales bacterium]
MAKFRHVVITGVSRGIGAALLKYFSGQGAFVSGCSSSSNMDEGTLEHAEISQVDIRSRIAVERWAKEVLSTHGAPDLLVNNASIGMKHGPFHTLDLRTIEDLLNVNYAGTIRVTHAFLRAMIDAGGGIIATLTTPPKGIPSKEIVPYAASKYGSNGFTQTLVGEKLPGITCVDIFPGILNTTLTRNSYGKKAERLPTPETWIEKAGPFFESLGPEHNGQHLSV